MYKIEDMKKQVHNTKPEILQEIQGILSTLYPNISTNIIFNILLERTAQMFTSKWILQENSSGKIIPNWYSLIFLKSGGGKDRLVSDLDTFILNDFIDYYKSMSESIYQAQKNGNNNPANIVRANERLNSMGKEACDVRNKCVF